jgi:hypothetical protein
MTPASPDQPSGWTVGKILGLVIGLLGMVGFGLCSLWGLVFGLSDSDLMAIVLMCSVPGLLIAYLCFLLVRKMLRLAAKPADRNTAPPDTL